MEHLVSTGFAKSEKSHIKNAKVKDAMDDKAKKFG